MPDGERRLAAIMFTDMVGYTALGQRNESLSLALVEEQRRLIRPILARHNGREIKTIGDAFLVEFPNALDAVRCAYDIQRATREFNISLPEEKKVRLRVGLHLGDVVESQGDISGDAVNVASRIEPLAEEGGVCMTHQVHDQVEGKFELPLVSLGPKSLKNVKAPVEVYKVVMPWEEAGEQPEAGQSPNRIAVLPFVSFSPDPADDYFANGITEEIISTVSGISGLSVISRTSVMGYKGTTKRVGEIGRELKVGSILEGSFRKAGNKIRVTTQLIEVAGDRHLWAQSYDRDLDDVFAVQSDIAKQVADSLRVKILPLEETIIAKAPTSNSEAYSLYLKGRQLWNERSKESIGRAVECFKQAVADDPSFALGYSGLADCYYILAANHNEELDVNYPRAKELVQRALRLDPNLAEAHATLAALYEFRDFDLKEADAEFRRAIELKPSYAAVHNWYYLLLMNLGELSRAEEEIKRALELDPLSLVINSNYIFFLEHKGEYGRAKEQALKTVGLHPNAVMAHETMLWFYLKRGLLDDYKRELGVYIGLPAEKDAGSIMALRAGLHFLKGEREEADKILTEIESRQKELNFSAYSIGGMSIFFGHVDRGFEWLERAYQERDPGVLAIKNDLSLDGVRSDPRYLDLVKRLGLG